MIYLWLLYLGKSCPGAAQRRLENAKSVHFPLFVLNNILLWMYQTQASGRKDGVSEHYSCGAYKVFRQIGW